MNDLRHSIAYQTPTTADQGGGVKRTTHATGATGIAAAIRQTNDRERMAYGQAQGVVTHVVKIRQPLKIAGETHRPTTKDRLLYDGRTLHVAGVENVDERGFYWRLVCREVEA